MTFKKGDLVKLSKDGKIIASLFFFIPKNLTGILIKKEFEPILSADKWTIYFPKKNKFLKLIEYEIDPVKLKNEPPK